MRVRWLRKALLDLDEEASYIASDDPVAASAVGARIFEAVNFLAEQANLGLRGRVPGTRELVVNNTRYIVPYRVKRETIELLRVFHSSRRPPKRW